MVYHISLIKGKNPLLKNFLEDTMTSYNIEEPIIKIRDYAFFNSSLQEISIPNTVVNIGEHAFGYCRIQSIIIPEGVTSIEASAFEYCARLTSVTLPNSLQTIKTEAFMNSGITSITFGSNLKTIEERAFLQCYSLKSITVPKNVTQLGEGAFKNCSLSEIYIPFVGASRNETSNTDRSEFGYIFGYDDNYTDRWAIPSSLKKVYITNARVIPWWSFGSSTNNRKSVNSITSIFINKEVTTIEGGAFEGCSKLTNITFESGSNLQRIENSALEDCTSLTSLTLPRTVTYIGSDVFNNTGITELEFEGTMSQWNSISKGTFWDYGSNIEVIHCSNGSISL